MPIITSAYTSPKYLFNGHIQTIFPHFARKVKGINYKRERIDTPDGDFLDLDWSTVVNAEKKLVVVSHGLEGSSNATYAKGMIKAFNRAGWDGLAWNYRGCSGVMNNKIYSYHSGATQDLDIVVKHVLQKKVYQQITLVGFSLGGNLTLKYAGEKEQYISKTIRNIIVFSVPCNLAASSRHISEGFNKIYAQRFLQSLGAKVQEKAKIFKKIKDKKLKGIKTLADFDNCFTAPLHGFKNAKDYYTRCSSEQFLPYIKIPTLIVNAKNDPFLPKACFPIAIAKKHPLVHLEIPDNGGHVGFYTSIFNKDIGWTEKRAIAFASEMT